MKKEILIIGFGNIGYRHFQSLYNNNKKYKFFIYDKILNDNIKKIQNLKNVKVLSNIVNKKIEKKIFDVVIISTTSKGRYELLKQILDNYKFKNMIIEKFLFAKEKNYVESLKLPNKIKDKIYVHCPRTEWKYFKDLKNKFINQKIKMEYRGKNWRMASNSIHFLDIFSFLIGSNEIKLKKITVNDTIKSKRDKYMEFSGLLIFKANNESSLILEDNKKFKYSVMKIKFSDFTDICKFRSNEMILKRYKSRKLILEKRYKVPLTSHLTNKIVNKIFKRKIINLSKLNKSIKLHMILFPILMKIFKNKYSINNILPVT